jgi:hypothetical protein
MLVRAALARAIPLGGDQGLAQHLSHIGHVRGGDGSLIDVDTQRALRNARRSRR